MDELLTQQVFIGKPLPSKRIHVPFIVYEINLFLLSWLGLVFLEEPPMVKFRFFLHIFLPNDARFMRIHVCKGPLIVLVGVIFVHNFFDFMKGSSLKCFTGCDSCRFTGQKCDSLLLGFLFAPFNHLKCKIFSTVARIDANHV